MVGSRFSVTFGEPTTPGGLITADDLALNLQAPSRLMAAASSLANPSRSPAVLSIDCIEPNAPIVDLVLSLDNETDRLTDLLARSPATILADVEAAVIGPRGVLQLERLARGRPSTAPEATETPGVSSVRFGDEGPVEVLDLALELHQDRRLRRSAAVLTNPARGLQIDGRALSSPTPNVGLDSKPDVAPSTDRSEPPAAADTSVEMLVDVAAPAFPVNNKWRLQNGQVGSFWATIGDGQFLNRVNAGEPFRKGDLLRCIFTITRTEGPDGIQTDHHVTKVLQHVARGQQLRLDDAA